MRGHKVGWPSVKYVKEIITRLNCNAALEWFVNCSFSLVWWSSLTSNDLSLSWPSWPSLCSSSAFESSDSRIFNSVSLLVVSSESWTPVKVSMGGVPYGRLVFGRFDQGSEPFQSLKCVTITNLCNYYCYRNVKPMLPQIALPYETFSFISFNRNKNWLVIDFSFWFDFRWSTSGVGWLSTADKRINKNIWNWTNDIDRAYLLCLLENICNRLALSVSSLVRSSTVCLMKHSTRSGYLYSVKKE